MNKINYSPFFDTAAQTLINPVNVVGVMGAGLSFECRKRFPEMFKAYKQYCDQGALDKGKLYLYSPTSGKWVLNLPIKRSWRDKSSMEWLEAGLKKLAVMYEANGVTSVAFPKQFESEGALHWGEERVLIEKILGKTKLTVHMI